MLLRLQIPCSFFGGGLAIFLSQLVDRIHAAQSHLYSQGFFNAPIIGITPGGFWDSLDSLFSRRYLGYVLGPRRLARMTHLCSDRVTHTENTIPNRIQNMIRDMDATSSTPKA